MKKAEGIVALQVAAMVGFCSGAGSVGRADVWQVQTVDSPGTAGWSLDLDVDHRGEAHALYLHDSGVLRYGSERNGVWSLAPTFEGSRGEVILDHYQRPSRLWVTSSPTTLHLQQQRNDASWRQVLALTTTDTVGDDPALRFAGRLNFASAVFVNPTDGTIDSIGLDALGNATAQPLLSDPTIIFNNTPFDSTLVPTSSIPATHLAWSSGGELKHAYDSGGTFVQTTPAGGAEALRVRLATDPTSGQVHLAYDDGGAIHHGIFFDGSWTTQTVTTRQFGVRLGGLAIDREGNPHLSFIATDTFSGPNVLYHARAADGSWVANPVTSWASTVSGPEVSDLDVDRAAGVHILFADDSRHVRYAYLPGHSTVTESIGASLDVQYTVNLNSGTSSITDGTTQLDAELDVPSDTRDTIFMEFDLDHLDATTPIVDVRLIVGVSRMTVGSQDDEVTEAPDIRAFAYLGDGSPDPNDPAASRGIVGFSGEVLETGELELVLDPDVIQSMVTEDSSIGLRLTAFSTKQFAIWSTEGAAAFGLRAPTLVVTYVPEPTATASLLLGLLAAVPRPHRHHN